jgi:hypothetical protein
MGQDKQKLEKHNAISAESAVTDSAKPDWINLMALEKLKATIEWH